MKISHTTHHRWHREVIEDPLLLYKKNNQKRLQSTLNKVDQTNITYEIEKVDNNFLEWFQPFYTEKVGVKENAKVHDLYKSTQPQDHIEDYYQLTLKEGGQRLGAIIFSLRKDDMLGVSFRALEHKWINASLQANPAIFTDYILAKFAYQQGKTIFSHGLDRNPYGVNAAIGLGTFKLTVGCTPKIPKNPEFTETDLTELKDDALILLPPERDYVIEKAILVCTQETEAKYAQLKAYPDRLKIEVKYRD